MTEAATLSLSPEREQRVIDAHARTRDLTTIYDELFELLHKLKRERQVAPFVNDADRLLALDAWRTHALKALYALNVYAQNGLRNNIDPFVLIDVAKHAFEYKTCDVKTSTQ